MAYRAAFPNGRKFSGRYLSVQFKDGEGFTDSDYLAERLQAKGLIVTDMNDEPPGQKPFSKMNTAELEAAAAELGADLTGCKTNKERAAKLTEALDTAEKAKAEAEAMDKAKAEEEAKAAEETAKKAAEEEAAKQAGSSVGGE